MLNRTKAPPGGRGIPVQHSCAPWPPAACRVRSRNAAGGFAEAYLRGRQRERKTDFKVLTDAAGLEAGKATYLQNCAACHGQHAEGMVGPNLTDEYWLHGGEVSEIFKTVKFGVTSKGMVAWQGKLSDDQFLEVSSFIGLQSGQGQSPAGRKAPAPWCPVSHSARAGRCWPRDYAGSYPADLFILATRDTHLAHHYLQPLYRKTQAC